MISKKLDIKALHMACEEKEITRDELEFAPRVPSSFVIEKLICAGAKTSETDENGIENRKNLKLK